MLILLGHSLSHKSRQTDWCSMVVNMAVPLILTKTMQVKVTKYFQAQLQAEKLFQILHLSSSIKSLPLQFLSIRKESKTPLLLSLLLIVPGWNWSKNLKPELGKYFLNYAYFVFKFRYQRKKTEIIKMICNQLYLYYQYVYYCYSLLLKNISIIKSNYLFSILLQFMIKKKVQPYLRALYVPSSVTRMQGDLHYQSRGHSIVKSK